MTKNKMAFGTPLEEFIESTITKIKGALPDGFKIKDDIEFELTVVSVGEKEGGLDLIVVNTGGQSIKEETHRIKFSVKEIKDKSGPGWPIRAAQTGRE
jgi:hypothetical protein